MNYTLSSYQTFEKNGKLIIKAEAAQNSLERFGVYGIFLVVTWILYSYGLLKLLTLLLPILTSNQSFIYINFILLLVPLPLAYYFKKVFAIKLFGITLFTIDKPNDLLTLNIENFQAKLSNIKEIQIIGETNEEETIKQYRLKFLLTDGEKITEFISDSPKTLEELIKIIKQ